MRAAFLRDLLLIARRPGMLAAAAANAAIPTAFLFAWTDAGRVPLLAGGNLYEQQRIVVWWFLAFAAPWTMARLMADERAGEWSRLSAVSGLTPMTLVAGRLLAAVVYLAVIVCAALPPVLLAQQMSPIGISTLAADQLALLSAAAGASSVTLWLEFRIARRLLGWSVSTMASAAIFAMLAGRPPEVTAIAGVALSVGAVAGLLWRADDRLWYLPEQTG
jgi:hypothetical protein